MSASRPMRSISSAPIALSRAYSSTWGASGRVEGGGAGGGVAGATGGGGGGGVGFGLPQAPRIDTTATIVRIRVHCRMLPPSFVALTAPNGSPAAARDPRCADSSASLLVLFGVVLHRLLEIADALSETLTQLGQPRGAEDEHDDDEDEEHLGKAEIEHGPLLFTEG